MALVSELVKVCGIKITTVIKGVKGCGSGVLYLTSNKCTYNYILTAKHNFQESWDVAYDVDCINSIDLYYNKEGRFALLEQISKKQLKEKIIPFEQDLAIVKVRKNDGIPFRQILVADELQDNDQKFIFWSIFKANESELQRFSLLRNDPENRRYQLVGNHMPEYIPGMSGAGVFLDGHNKLYGIISRYPNTAFQNATIDCSRISFIEINTKLASLGLELLETQFSRSKREIGSEVVDIHQVYINNTCLDLEQARKRLKVDIADDWYHDPLRYNDLLTQDYLFEAFAKYFGQQEKYEVSEAEIFYVPKKKFTLRLSLVSPFLDRVLYMACVGLLARKLDEAMIPNVFSARFDRFSSSRLILNGVEQWKKMRYCLGEYAAMKTETGAFKYGCVIEIDLLNFYDNISKSLLHKKILRVCQTENEENAASLLFEILYKMSKKDIGLPQNSDASSLLASFYLNQVDVFMLHHTSAYFRFMDDIRIFCSDKYEARRLLQLFEYELRRCYLSVNSQKTEIFTLVEQLDPNSKKNERNRYDLNNIFDLQINRIVRLRKSRNHALRNEAFHECIRLLSNKLIEGDDVNEDSAKKINYAFNTLAVLGANGVTLTEGATGFKEVLTKSVNELKDKPWFTAEVCRVLNLVPDSDLPTYMSSIVDLVLNSKYNTYTFQVYHIWLLLAKRKWLDAELTNFAITQIERNDDTSKPVIAAMVIYLCSVDPNYKRVIVRKFDEGFTHGYFQCRLGLIAVRSFSEELLNQNKIHPKLYNAHQFTHRFGERDLVYVPGFDEDVDGEEVDFEEQLFSL